MSSRFATLGNDLYTGEKSVPVVAQRRRFYIASAVVMLIAVLGLVFQGLNLGLEFRGGSEFRVATTSLPATYEDIARQAIGATESQRAVNVTVVGNNTVRVQTERLNDTDSQAVRQNLAEAFGVPTSEVSGTFIGPSWGASVSQQALRALVIFLALVAVVMSIYFRNWKMAAAALIAVVHDMIITVGIYALIGFEVSPATMIVGQMIECARHRQAHGGAQDAPGVARQALAGGHVQKLLHRRPQRPAFQHQRHREHDDRPLDAAVRLRLTVEDVPDLLAAFPDADRRTDEEDATSDDERPEVGLGPVSKRVKRVGGSRAAPHPD